MRTVLAGLALLTTLSTSAQAQRSWQTEFGIQGGFTRLVEAGSGASPFDAISIPGFNLGNALPSTAGLYLIIPASNKIATHRRTVPLCSPGNAQHGPFPALLFAAGDGRRIPSPSGRGLG